MPYEELMSTAEGLAEQMMENPALAVRDVVRIIRRFPHEMQRESMFYSDGLRLHLSEDFRESAAAFLEKRKPVFTGRCGHSG